MQQTHQNLKTPATKEKRANGRGSIYLIPLGREQRDIGPLFMISMENFELKTLRRSQRQKTGLHTKDALAT